MSDRRETPRLADLMLPVSRYEEKLTRAFPRVVSLRAVFGLGLLLVVVGAALFWLDELLEPRAHRVLPMLLVPLGLLLALLAGYRILTGPSIARERRRAVEEWRELERDLAPLLPDRREVFRVLVERGNRCSLVRRSIYACLRKMAGSHGE